MYIRRAIFSAAAELNQSSLSEWTCDEFVCTKFEHLRKKEAQWND